MTSPSLMSRKVSRAMPHSNPANRSDRSIVDPPPIAHETPPGTAWDLALRDVRAGDRAVPGSPKGHTHLGRPEDALHLGGGEPSHQDRLAVVEQLVDDAVGAGLA